MIWVTCLISSAPKGLHVVPLRVSVVEGQHLLRCRPFMLALNCNLSRMSIIDINGVLSFYDLEAKGSGKGGTQGEHLAFERKVREDA
eukprot:1158916-Pelagomonas_calceolata.AAC.12